MTKGEREVSKAFNVSASTPAGGSSATQSEDPTGGGDIGVGLGGLGVVMADRQLSTGGDPQEGAVDYQQNALQLNVDMASLSPKICITTQQEEAEFECVGASGPADVSTDEYQQVWGYGSYSSSTAEGAGGVGVEGAAKEGAGSELVEIERVKKVTYPNSKHNKKTHTTERAGTGLK
ncbi:unnamed protein product [Vitrella brassicaformis CCMP3155]|uniref:Uncharacterized protein n=1 Tax=Vitrella brassicaformis (strain CCMP3155) TaxID=1169540 RepID=A0A0G4FXC3_VITBC|nr:unnamed protein product [Vitrella brassicaformis CCMP3155]|eukprot:CEM20053.1 unnamed protein product [Vitrella brassicaformis CCMP3155]